VVITAVALRWGATGVLPTAEFFRDSTCGGLNVDDPVSSGLIESRHPCCSCSIGRPDCHNRLVKTYPKTNFYTDCLIQKPIRKSKQICHTDHFEYKQG